MMRHNESLEAASINFYSFWNPEVPPKQSKKQKEPVKLNSIGVIKTMTGTILKIQNVLPLSMTGSSDPGILPIRCFIWDVDTGVVIRMRPEYGQDNVYCIEALSAISDDRFYPLYVQLIEHFGVHLYDEVKKSFITLKEFRKIRC